MGGVQIGAVAGVNVFTFGGSDASGVTSRTAFYGGVALTVPLGASAFLEPQVVYSAEGAKTTVNDSTLGTIERTFKLGYIEVPILFGFNFGRAGGTRPHLYAGPAVGINVGCDMEAAAEGITVTSSCSDAGVTVKTIDLGVTGGGGVTFPVGRGTISIDARYTLGLTDVFDGPNMKNQGFSVGAGFTIPLGLK